MLELNEMELKLIIYGLCKLRKKTNESKKNNLKNGRIDRVKINDIRINETELLINKIENR